MMNQVELFSESSREKPLAERLRPKTLEEVLGQNRILGPGTLLRRSIESKKIPSMIFWGPPGCGKTTLAEVIRHTTQLPFKKISAVHAGVKEVKEILKYASGLRGPFILFIDEIHRFNKAQQDSLLHAVEEGLVTLIGATTENPSFEVNSALLSRCQLLLFSPMNPEDAKKLIQRAWTSPEGLQMNIPIAETVQEKLISEADGDVRFLLNQLEWISELAQNVPEVDTDFLAKIQYEKPLRYDKSGEEHYNLISVLHKSIRGSDVQAALYWLHRMLQGGEDPRYILRRLMRMAVEDVGLADPQALVQATSARECFDFLGVPEGLLALDQLVIYLSNAPKSNSVELAYFAAEKTVRDHGNLPVPRAFRNAVNKTGKELGYGSEYLYDHDSPNAYSGQEHLPKALTGLTLYEPKPYGYEKEVQKRMAQLKEWKTERESEK